MLFGRAHSAGMAVVAEFVLEEGMKHKDSAIYLAFCDKFPHIQPDDWAKQISHEISKKELFTEIRDAVLNVRKCDPLDKSPLFKHFADMHIVKLNYNEGDRIFVKKSASARKFMRPERIKVGCKFGQIYRLQTATTANKASIGAVTEALANDLTRLAGVPSQELRIVRGMYSDGAPKLMLEAKFTDGYQDMENGFIKDGQIVHPKGSQVESLGRYKAFFLVTANREAVGSSGQNKGFVQGKNWKPGKFFVIDPGHSLEGNGRYLEAEHNLSFKDTYGFSTKPRFKNFPVFENDTRFAKFQGGLDLRALKNSGKAEELFISYLKVFDSKVINISDAEKSMRVELEREIKKKEAEFNDFLAKILINHKTSLSSMTL